MGLPDDTLSPALAAAGVDPDWQPETAEDRAAASALSVAALALTPDFLFR
jgi:hypothetical protein